MMSHASAIMRRFASVAPTQRRRTEGGQAMIHCHRKAGPSHGGLGRAVLQLATVAGLVALSGLAVPAQTARTLRIIVPLPPGGAGDIVARQLAEQVGRAHGVSVVIENHPGAGTIIGTELVAKAAPDGNTLLVNAPYLLISPQLRKVNFDPLTSFAPVCHLVSSPGVIVVNSASPYRSLADLIAAARARPGELTLASVGPGTAQHIGFEMLRRAARIDVTYVPYAGGAPAINALLVRSVARAGDDRGDAGRAIAGCADCGRVGLARLRRGSVVGIVCAGAYIEGHAD
jgi:tripartite-type tricarboxylate transporter receptor subunit TctC